MTEQEAWDNPEMKVILLLGGYVRELGEGKDFEKTTYKIAKQIVKLFAMPAVVLQSEQLVCPHCGKCYINYDTDGSRLGWECKRLP